MAAQLRVHTTSLQPALAAHRQHALHHSCRAVDGHGRHPSWCCNRALSWSVSPAVQLQGAATWRRAATVTDQGSSSSNRDVLDFLAARGIDLMPLQSAARRNPALPALSVELRVAPILNYLLAERGLDIKQVELMLLKCPQLFSVDLHHKVLPAVAFLAAQPPSGLGLQQEEVDVVLRRFPQVLSYGVKAHLVPQVHYLMSLGVASADLPALVLARPQVLGSSIELVVTYLRRYMGIKRHNVGRLLRTFPIDYSIRHLVLPSVEEEQEQDGQEEQQGPTQGSGGLDSGRHGDGGHAGDEQDSQQHPGA